MTILGLVGGRLGDVIDPGRERTYNKQIWIDSAAMLSAPDNAAPTVAGPPGHEQQ